MDSFNNFHTFVLNGGGIQNIVLKDENQKGRNPRFLFWNEGPVYWLYVCLPRQLYSVVTVQGDYHLLRGFEHYYGKRKLEKFSNGEA